MLPKLLATWLITILCFAPSPGLAWVRHNLITHYALQETSWLDDYEHISVTPYTYLDDSLNPEFKVIYVNPDPAQISPPVDKFVYYDLASEQKAGYRGQEIGGASSAREILADYSDEPDWGMDKELKLSPAQTFMAGSQGYRHMYYPAWSWHLPCLFFPQGAAPKRAEHFYNLAKQALKKGDFYWGFRFLARVLHYIEDMGQPYHTTQTSLHFLNPLSPVAGTTQATKNYHFAYESFVGYRLQQEAAGLMPERYILALRQAPVIWADNVKDLLKLMAKQSNEQACITISASIALFGKSLNVGREVPLTQKDVTAMLHHSQLEQFNQAVCEAMSLSGGGVRGFLNQVKLELFDALTE
jgi:hypothetical protein